MSFKTSLAMLVVALSGISVLAQTNATRLPDAPSVCKPVLLNQYLSASLNSQNRRALPNSPAYVPLTGTQKFQIFVDSLKSPLTFMSAGIGASVQYAVGTRMCGDGLGGFGGTYGASLATKESNVFFGRYLFPMLLNQDPRYHPSESRDTFSRSFYAASRVFVTRNDKGAETANTSYLLSTILSSSLANAYKPAYYRSFANTASDIGTQIGSDAGMNVLREFWPQLREGLTRVEPSPFRKLREKIHDKFAGGDEPQD